MSLDKIDFALRRTVVIVAADLLGGFVTAFVRSEEGMVVDMSFPIFCFCIARRGLELRERGTGGEGNIFRLSSVDTIGTG